MVFNVCVKFHENMSSGFKVMERTRKLLTDTHTHTQRKDENIIPPWHTSYTGGIITWLKCKHERKCVKIFLIRGYIETSVLEVTEVHCIQTIRLKNLNDSITC